jgi:hypothetical protein
MIFRWLTRRMFIGAEMPLTVGFDDARAGLAQLIRGGLLGRASGGAYDEWRTALARDGPWGTAPWGTALGMSRLARVQFHATAGHGDLAIWPLRWEVTGPQGALVPVLDADIKLTPAGADASLLAVLAACRPPLGGLTAGLDQAIVRRCATAMIQAFTRHIAAAVTHLAASPGARHDGILPEAWPEPETP